MATGKLSPSTFISGPDDKLGVADVYNQSASSIVNSYQSEFHDVKDALDGFLSGALSLPGNLNFGLDFMNGTLNNLNNLVNGNIRGMLNISMSPLGMVNGLVNNALRTVGKLNGVLNGISSLPNRTLSNLLGAGNSFINGYTNTLNGINRLSNTSIGATNYGRRVGSSSGGGYGGGGYGNPIRTITPNIVGGLNTKPYTNPYQNNNNNVDPTRVSIGNTLQDRLSSSVASYGTLNPAANNLRSSINNELDVLVGGDRAAVTAILKPATKRIDTLNKPSQFDNGSTTLTTERMLESITQPELVSAVRDLSPEAQEMIVRGLSEEKSFSDNKIVVDGKASVISPEVSEQNKKAIGDIINAVTDGNYKVNTKAEGIECNMLSGVIHLASKAGFPKPFETIAKHKSPELLVEIAKPLLRRAVEEGDFDLINDIASTSVAKEIPIIVPNLIYELKANLKKPDNLSQQEYARYYKVIKDIFNKINANWIIFQSGRITAVDAIGVSENPFFADLIEAQLNELKAPEANLSNLQVVYPLEGITDTTKLLNEIGLPEPTITYDEAGNELITPPPLYVKPETLKIDPLHYKNEPFLLIGKVFMDNSVDSEIKKHFPFFYETIEVKPIPTIK